jgi:hypothetical protein
LGRDQAPEESTLALAGMGQEEITVEGLELEPPAEIVDWRRR